MTKNFNILTELRELDAQALIAAGNDNYFSIPESYFDELPAIIISAVFLQSIPVYNPYSVPSGYFENFSSNVLRRINEQKSFVLIADKMPAYSIPNNYFDDLAKNILARIKNQPNQSEIEQELQSLSPFLNSIPKINVYTAPENYFEGLHPSVNKKSTPAKVVSFKTTSRWINYAAAACIAVLLIGGGYFYLGGKAPHSGVAATAEPSTNVEVQISDLSDDEIASYLTTNSNTGIYTNTGADGNQSRNIDVQNLLQNISDEEIQQYLDQNEEPALVEGGI